MKSLIINTIQKLGEQNIPISEIVESIANESDNWDSDDIQSLILDMCKNNEGIHYGMSNNKRDVTVSINTAEPVKLPPNQNPYMK